MKKKGRWWKIILIVLASLILLVLSAVHTVLYTRVKDKLISKYTEPVLEGKVRVDKIRVKLLTTLPDFSLYISNVSLTRPVTQDTVLAISRIQAQLNLRSLIKDKCLDMHDAGIFGLYANVVPADTSLLKPSGPKEEKEDEPLNLPHFKADFTLADTHLYFADIVKDGSLEFNLKGANSKDNVLDADLTGFSLKALGLTLDATVLGRDLLGENPQVDLDADALARLRALRSLLPEGMAADGEVRLTADGTLARSGADLLASVSTPSLRAQLPFGRVAADDVKIVAGARNKTESLPRRRPHREGMEVPDFLREEDFRAADIDVQLDSSITELVKTWNPRGSIHVGHAVVITPLFPLRNSLEDLDASFNTNEVLIDNVKVRTGESDLQLKGYLRGFGRMLTGRGKGLYRMDLEAFSRWLNLNQLLAAVDAGKDAQVDTTSGVSDEEYMAEVLESQPEESAEGMKLFVIPANVIADVRLKAGAVKYMDYNAREVGARIQMKERTVLVSDLAALTDAGSISADAFYSTKTKQNIGAGFDLSLRDVTAEKIIEMVPAVDSLVPMLSSFKGKLNCTFCASTKLDTSFRVHPRSLDGAFFIKGQDLTLNQEGDFKKLARILMFRDRRQGRIDSLYIGGIVTDSKVRVFPTRIDLDRYSLSLGGTHAFDGDFDYKVSLLRSPILIKFGVRLKGPDFNHISWKLIKPQFINAYMPEFRGEVDKMIRYQRMTIRNVYKEGSDSASKAGKRALKELDSRRADLEMIDSVQELSAEEAARLDSLQTAPAPADTVDVSPREGEKSPETIELYE
ncbi:MAG: hypothetical protein IKS71_00205 [Bacteroidales bacterium]|nr:hypothetical protein [Bacteroidales bacterium]